jgi:hypothetical protein
VAEAEAVRAAEELSFSPSLHALAQYEMGDVRRRLGDLAGAEEAFELAHALGMEPQPDLACCGRWPTPRSRPETSRRRRRRRTS